MKIRDAIFTIVTAAVLLLVLAPAALSALPGGFSLPERSMLEGRDYQVLPDSGRCAAFRTGEYQDAFEQFVADRVVGRDEALLLNAAVQRGCIRTANLAFGYEAYPTYFDSKYLYLPRFDALAHLPRTASDEDLAGLSRLSSRVADVAAAHPEARFTLCLVPCYDTSAGNPAAELVADPFSFEDCSSALDAGLASAENAGLLALPYATGEEYYEDFFRTDHHWNARGAMNAHDALAAELGWESLDATVQPVGDEGGSLFVGAVARQGLDLVYEQAQDVDREFGDIEIELPSGTSFSAQDHSAFFDAPAVERLYGFYELYYETKPQRGIYRNAANPAGGRALVVADSLGAGVIRMIASHYSEVVLVDDLHTSARDRSLARSLDAGSFDDVILIAHVKDYVELEEHSPAFFDGLS